MTRKAVVAGSFYTEDPALLAGEVSGFLGQKRERVNAIGVISPHAGYKYSGEVAGEVFSSIKPKKTYVVLGTNHTGSGKPFGLDWKRTWETPLGNAVIDDELAAAVLENSRYIKADRACHDSEHSIEVQIPFLQSLNKNFTFVPIGISAAGTDTYKEIGTELAKTFNALKKDVTIIASSDMTHYEPQETAKKKDMLAIEKILTLDVDGFLRTIGEYGISMCGFAPTAVMMQASIALGGKNARLASYKTSGDASGDYSRVVGYAGVVIY